MYSYKYEYEYIVRACEWGTMRTALSKSQSLKMMSGDLPPSSSVQSFALLHAQLHAPDADASVTRSGSLTYHSYLYMSSTVYIRELNLHERAPLH